MLRKPMATHLPAWLFNDYSRLFNRLGEGPFTLAEASSILQRSPPTLLVVLSQLRKRGYLVLFGRHGRTRVYRLIDPRDALYAYEFLKNLDRIGSKQFVPISIKTTRLLGERYKDRLISICVYGSAARGTAGPTSDVDLLLVVEGLRGSVGKRLQELYESISGIENERKLLSASGHFADISLFPLSPSESASFLPIYLDIIDEGVIIYDKANFLENVLTRCRSMLTEAGAEKVSTRHGWFWRVNPNMLVGEAIAV